MPRGWDGADRRSSSGSPSPLRSPAACRGRHANVLNDSRLSTGIHGALVHIARGLLSLQNFLNRSGKGST